MRARRIPGFLLLLVLWIPLQLQSAIQGEPGARDSQAVTTISLSVEPTIQISNVSDIDLDVSDRNQDVVYEEQICIRGNVGSRYSVTAASQDGDQSPFRLRTDTGDSIGYEVYFRGDLSQSVREQLFPGESSPFYEMQTREQNCNGENTASFTVIFRSEDLLPAEPGVYSGFLTLTVAAE